MEFRSSSLVLFLSAILVKSSLRSIRQDCLALRSLALIVLHLVRLISISLPSAFPAVFSNAILKGRGSPAVSAPCSFFLDIIAASPQFIFAYRENVTVE